MSYNFDMDDFVNFRKDIFENIQKYDDHTIENICDYLDAYTRYCIKNNSKGLDTINTFFLELQSYYNKIAEWETVLKLRMRPKFNNLFDKYSDEISGIHILERQYNKTKLIDVNLFLPLVFDTYKSMCEFKYLFRKCYRYSIIQLQDISSNYSNIKNKIIKESLKEKFDSSYVPDLKNTDFQYLQELNNDLLEWQKELINIDVDINFAESQWKEEEYWSFPEMQLNKFYNIKFDFYNSCPISVLKECAKNKELWNIVRPNKKCVFGNDWPMPTIKHIENL